MKSNASKQSFAKRKKELLKWEKIKEEKGVMVAASKEIEWLLPWWWKNYSYTNFYPVIFVDFGMTVEAKKWCQERGQLIALPKLPKGFVASKKQIDPELLEKWKFFLKKAYSFYLVRRSFFFKKPLAFLYFRTNTRNGKNEKTRTWINVEIVSVPIIYLFELVLIVF